MRRIEGPIFLRLRSAASHARLAQSTNPSLSQDADKIVKFSAKLTTAAGIGIVASYCVKERFFPSGLSLGDTFFFLLTSMAFGFLYGYLVSAAVFTCGPLAKWLLRVRQKKMSKKTSAFQESPAPPPKKNDKILVMADIFHGGFVGVLRILVALFLALIYALLVRPEDWIEIPLFVVIMIVIGCMIYIAFVDDSPEFKAKPWLRPVAIAVFIAAPIIFIPQLMGPLIESTMSAIGVRINNATIGLPANEYAFVRAAAKRAGGEMGECEAVEGGNCLLIADVLFQGVGEKALIRLHVSNSSDRKDHAANGKKIAIRAVVTSKTMQLAVVQLRKNETSRS